VAWLLRLLRVAYCGYYVLCTAGVCQKRKPGSGFKAVCVRDCPGLRESMQQAGRSVSARATVQKEQVAGRGRQEAEHAHARGRRLSERGRGTVQAVRALYEQQSSVQQAAVCEGNEAQKADRAAAYTICTVVPLSVACFRLLSTRPCLVCLILCSLVTLRQYSSRLGTQETVLTAPLLKATLAHRDQQRKYESLPQPEVEQPLIFRNWGFWLVARRSSR